MHVLGWNIGGDEDEKDSVGRWQMNNCCSTNHKLTVKTIVDEKMNPNIPNQFESFLIS